MKKLKLNLTGKEMLSKDQMKRISGGYTYQCCAVGVTPAFCAPLEHGWANCCQAQGVCDAMAWDPALSHLFPNGGDVVCPEWGSC
jgi:natural product precursor